MEINSNQEGKYCPCLIGANYHITTHVCSDNEDAVLKSVLTTDQIHEVIVEVDEATINNIHNSMQVCDQRKFFTLQHSLEDFNSHMSSWVALDQDGETSSTS